MPRQCTVQCLPQWHSNTQFQLSNKPHRRSRPSSPPPAPPNFKPPPIAHRVFHSPPSTSTSTSTPPASLDTRTSPQTTRNATTHHNTRPRLPIPRSLAPLAPHSVIPTPYTPLTHACTLSRKHHFYPPPIHLQRMPAFLLVGFTPANIHPFINHHTSLSVTSCIVLYQTLTHNYIIQSHSKPYYSNTRSNLHRPRTSPPTMPPPPRRKHPSSPFSTRPAPPPLQTPPHSFSALKMTTIPSHRLLREMTPPVGAVTPRV